MTPGNEGKVSPGDPFRAPPAVIWNNMVDAGRAFADSRLSQTAPSPTRSRPTDLIKQKNSSGAIRRKGEILKIDGKIITTVTEENIWLDGIETTTGCRFGILKKPADEDEIVVSQVSGVCMALVNVTDEDHEFANVSEEEYVLQSAGSGPLEILFAPDGTGELECVVRFSAVGGASVVRFSYSATNGIASAICEIKSRPVGASVPDTVLDGSAIIVHDPSGCYFNGPPEELTGRHGWAAYMQGDLMPDQVYEAPHWEVFAMCCDDSECYE